MNKKMYFIDKNFLFYKINIGSIKSFIIYNSFIYNIKKN
jgi:hypothetical protein